MKIEIKIESEEGEIEAEFDNISVARMFLEEYEDDN